MQKEPFALESVPSRKPNTRVLRLTGALVLQNIFELQAELNKENPAMTILDLAGVPYMDSAGMGVIINYYVSTTKRGNKVIAAGASYRVLELFRMTHVDTIIPLVASVEEAESQG